MMGFHPTELASRIFFGTAVETSYEKFYSTKLYVSTIKEKFEQYVARIWIIPNDVSADGKADGRIGGSCSNKMHIESERAIV